MHKRTLAPRHYYDLQPEIFHATGDIWCNIPTFGLLKRQRTSALVITPACDLANQKARSMTFLPIVPLRDWFVLPDFLPEVQRVLPGQCNQLNLALDEAIHQTSQPPLESLQSLEDSATSRKNDKKCGNKKRLSATRIQIGVAHIRRILAPDVDRLENAQLSLLFGDKKWTTMCNEIIRNSYSTDIHFLPSDEHDPEVSAIPEPALVLFRYPMTVPIDILDCANDLSLTDWDHALSSLTAMTAFTSEFKGVRPLKSLRLYDKFLVDILTRFTALYNRIGSPDFSADTVNDIITTL